MVLHLLSTTVMVRLGFVAGNLMSHVVPASDKLRRRARRIVMSLAGVGPADAARLLEECEGDTAAAITLARERERP